MKPESARVSAHARLAGMPAVFGVDDLERALDMPRQQAILYAYRWVKAGLVVPLGRKVGMWFNLVVDRTGPQTRRAEAVSFLLRRPALVVGGKALLSHGWTTQRHTVTALAVPIGRTIRSLPQLDHGLELLPRSMRWYRKLSEGAQPGVEGFQVARPEMALADALLADARSLGHGAGHAMTWTPTPDEICFDDDEEDIAKVFKALSDLSASPEEVDKIAGSMDWDVPGLGAPAI
jgi:hypothetical protein